MAFSKSVIGFTRKLFQTSNLAPTNKYTSLQKFLSTDSTDKTTSSTSNQSIDEYESQYSSEFDEPVAAEEPTKITEEKKHEFTIAKALYSKSTGWQPTAETHKLLMFDGVPFNKLHTVYVAATKNNTILTLVDSTGACLYSVSAGGVGFKNCKKSTAIAGQAVGLAMSDHIKRRGVKNLRVMLKGFGNGRLPSVKALQMSKLNVVSITDQTPIPLTFAKPPRPPVPRRV